MAPHDHVHHDGLSQDEDRPVQLSLLGHRDVPLQFRLDRRTRERGLAHIAAIRRQLAEQAERRGKFGSAA